MREMFSCIADKAPSAQRPNLIHVISDFDVRSGTERSNWRLTVRSSRCAD